MPKEERKKKPSRRPVESAATVAKVVLMTWLVTPSTTHPLTEEQKNVVAAAIEELPERTATVKELIAAGSDELFRSPTQDAVPWSDMLADVERRVQDIFSDGRVVTQPAWFFRDIKKAAGEARGAFTPGEERDHIVMGATDDGELLFSLGTLMHEGAHFWYGPHGLTIARRNFGLNIPEPLRSELKGSLLPTEKQVTKSVQRAVDVPTIVGDLYTLAESVEIQASMLMFYARDLPRSSEDRTAELPDYIYCVPREDWISQQVFARESQNIAASYGIDKEEWREIVFGHFRVMVENAEREEGLRETQNRREYSQETCRELLSETRGNPTR